MSRPSMFPEESVNAITIYPVWTNPDTGKQIGVRCVLYGCVWLENSISIANKTGNQTDSKTSIKIPYLSMFTSKKYISPTEWNQLPQSDLEDYWTIARNPSSNQLPLITKGESAFEFEWTEPDGTMRMTLQENNLLAANQGFRRIADINEALLGIPPEKNEDWVRENLKDTYRDMWDMWHIALMC